MIRKVSWMAMTLAVTVSCYTSQSWSSTLTLSTTVEEANKFVGKHFWLYSYSSFAQICPQAGSPFGCVIIHPKGWLVIDSVARGKFPQDQELYYHAKFEDGHQGWFYDSFAVELEAEDPKAVAAKAKAKCEAAGQPKIGMTYEQAIATCWGPPPLGVSRTTTAAAGEHWQAIYGDMRYLYFDNGLLTVIQQ